MRQTDREQPVREPMVSSQSEGLGKTVLGKGKYFYDRPSQPIGVLWFAASLFAVSGCGPESTSA